jgi:hypothetical protein
MFDRKVECPTGIYTCRMQYLASVDTTFLVKVPQELYCRQISPYKLIDAAS